jgi:glycosyltransferase involved in cell wall biosynthesis
MRIAIINEPWNGGATRCARDLLNGLKAKHEVWLCPDGVAPRSREVLPLLHAFKPDVVHLHAFYGWLGYETLGAVARRYPTAFTPHDPRPIGQIEPACWQCDLNTTCFRCPLIAPAVKYTLVKHRYFWQRLKKQFVHRRTPKTLEAIGVSQWYVERMRKQEMRRFQLRHLPNGIDTAVFRRVEDARQRLGLAEDIDLILFLSTPSVRWRINERKGMLPLAEAFLDHIAPRFPNAVLAVAGDLLVPNHPRVRGLGYVAKEDLPLWYSAATTYVLPSMGDNLPYTVLEAMGCECPVVATAVGGIPEQVEDGKTGLLLPDNAPASIAAALTVILQDRSRAREMGKAGRRKVLETYMMERFLQQHEELYEALFQGNLSVAES